MTYDEVKDKGTLLSQDEATEFYNVDGQVYMVLLKENNKVEKVED